MTGSGIPPATDAEGSPKGAESHRSTESCRATESHRTTRTWRSVLVGLGHGARDYLELLAVLAAVAVGLTIRSPLAWAASHDGIDILLGILVFAVGLTIEPAAIRRLPRHWRPLLFTVASGVTVLPALAWAVGHLVAPGFLRDGVLTVGLAPCEIASVATTTLAGGEAVLATGVLIASTLATIAVAGPILSLEVGHSAVHPAAIAANLALVVLLPLVAGMAVRACVAFGQPWTNVATTVAMLTVAGLVAEIAAEIHFAAGYLGVAGALVAYVAGSALVGQGLGLRSDRPVATAVLLTVSMRDFAIAAGLAAAAFGAAAAAPLGLYGVAVLGWGTAVVGWRRQRSC